MLSFLIPAYNAMHTILHCLKSIDKQTVDDYEVVVIDDGSTDETAAILRDFCISHSKFYFESQRNAGACVARNRALEKARGSYICFLDADDYISPYFVETIAPACRKQKWDVVSFGYAEGRIRNHEFHFESEAIEQDISSDWLLARMVCTLKEDEDSAMRPAAVWGKAYRADFVRSQKAHFIDGLMANQDVMFNIDLFTGEQPPRCCFIDACLYYYWVNDQGVCRKYIPNIDSDIRKMANILLQHTEMLDKDLFERRLACRMLSYLTKAVVQCYCNSSNRSDFLARRRAFLRLCDYEPIRENVAALRLHDFNFENKLVLFASRSKLFVPMDCFLHAKTMLKRRFLHTQ